MKAGSILRSPEYKTPLTRRITLKPFTLAETEELLHSGFISMNYPFGKKKKDTLYRLSDEYSLFYIRFIEKNRSEGQGVWQQLSQTQAYTSWAGYAFESICLKHLPQIKKALGISGVYSTASTFFKKGSEEEDGLQIDLLIDRKDHVVNLCEMKFYSAEMAITLCLRALVAD